jgi:hypothetical protein
MLTPAAVRPAARVLRRDAPGLRASTAARLGLGAACTTGSPSARSAHSACLDYRRAAQTGPLHAGRRHARAGRRHAATGGRGAPKTTPPSPRRSWNRFSPNRRTTRHRRSPPASASPWGCSTTGWVATTRPRPFGWPTVSGCPSDTGSASAPLVTSSPSQATDAQTDQHDRTQQPRWPRPAPPSVTVQTRQSASRPTVSRTMVIGLREFRGRTLSASSGPARSPADHGWHVKGAPRRLGRRRGGVRLHQRDRPHAMLRALETAPPGEDDWARVPRRP